MPADPIHLAQRIQVDDTLATVRYIGPVPPTPGEWLGVEWDNPLRGKHDGFHNGVRYFHCSVPNSGSFIRPNPAKIFTGRPFLAALVERYMPSLPNAAKDDAGGYSAEQDVGIIHFGGDRSIEVEIVGFEKIERKQKHLDQLQEVGLAQTQISSAGTPGEIKRIAPHIHDLDLSKNLITDWSVIAQIISQLHELEVLRLNHTRFDPLPTPLPLGLEHAFTSLRSLALNYTRISWREIQHFEPALPLLENLQLAGNGIRELSGGEAEGEETVHGFKNLKWLNLEENVIEAWGEVARLRELENLEVLYLNDNLLPSIDDTTGFRTLRFLQINNTRVADWASIDRLNALPALTELRCKGNPVLQGVELDRVTTLIVGRIKGLTKLNGNTILPKDRQDMERYYLHLTSRDADTEEEIERLHPRYKELCEVHGAPAVGASNKDLGSTVLKDRLIDLKITSRDSIDGDVIKAVNKKFLGTLTIRNLRNLLARLLSVPAARQRLYCVQTADDEGNPLPAPQIIELADELKEITFYDVRGGDEIVVVRA